MRSNLSNKLLSILNNVIGNNSDAVSVSDTKTIPRFQVEFSYKSLSDHRIPTALKDKMEYWISNAVISNNNGIMNNESVPEMLLDLASYINRHRFDMKLVESTSDRVTWHLGGDFFIYIDTLNNTLKISSAFHSVNLNTSKTNKLACKEFLTSVKFSEYTSLI